VAAANADAVKQNRMAGSYGIRVWLPKNADLKPPLHNFGIGDEMSAAWEIEHAPERISLASPTLSRAQGRRTSAA